MGLGAVGRWVTLVLRWVTYLERWLELLTIGFMCD